MTKEEKQLLLIDLCARLPYGVMITDGEITRMLEYLIMVDLAVEKGYRPYLRPMSSMTEEEMNEYELISADSGWGVTNRLISGCSDWLNKNMFDYRGLIPMGLALKAPKDMYKEGKK